MNETLHGIFVIVKSGDDAYLINIVGEIPKNQLGGLLLNLHQLGIEIPELMSLKPRDLEIAPPPPLPTPAPVEAEAPKQKHPESIDTVEDTLSLQEIQEPTTSWNWTV